MDHLNGLSFRQTVGAPPTDANVDGVTLGRLQPAAKVPRAEKAEKENRSFADKFERESFFNQLEIKKGERAKEQAKEQELSAEASAARTKNKKAAPWARLHVKIRLQPDFSSTEPYLDVVFVLSWNENELQQSTEVVLRLTPSSFLRSDTAPTNTLWRDWIQWHDIDGDRNGVLAELSSSAFPDLRDMDHGVLSDAAEIRLFVQGDKVHGMKLFANNDTDFGPHGDAIARLRPLLHNNFTIRILVNQARTFATMLESYVRAIDTVHGTASPLTKHWADSARLLLQKGQRKERLQRPRVIEPATIAFSGVTHFMTVEGLGAIDALEFEQDQLAQPILKVKARFLLMDGGGPIHAATQFLIVLQTEGSEIRQPLRPGDSIRIRIRKLNPRNVATMFLTGKVQPLPPFAFPGDVAAVVNTPKDHDAKPASHKPLDLRPLGSIPTASQIASAEQASDALGRCKAQLVDVHRDVDTRQLKRTVANFMRMAVLIRHQIAADPHGRSVDAELLCGGRLDRLPREDLLAGLDERRVQHMMASFTEDQKRVEPLLRNAPAGLAIVRGAAGSGKSLVVDELALTVILSGIKAVIVSPLNTNVDKHAVYLATGLRASGREFMVVRLFNKTTESGIIKRQGPDAEKLTTPNRGSFDEAVRDRVVRDLPASSAEALTLFEWHDTVTHREFRVSDKRLNQLNAQFSVGWWVLHLAGLLDGTTPRNIQFRKVKEQVLSFLAQEYHRYAGTEDEELQEAGRWGEEEVKAFGDLLAEAQRYVLSLADAIVTTPALATEERVYLHAREVGFVGIDEASRVSTSEFVGLRSAYPRARMVAVCDPWQLKGVVTVPASYGGFTPQQFCPPLIRLIIAGLETAHLTKQQRYGNQLCAVVSQLYYRHSLSVAPGFAYSEAAKTRRSLLKRTFKDAGRRNSIFILNVSDTTERLVGASKSRINIDTGAYALTLALNLIQLFSYAASEVQVIAAYGGQVDLLKRAVALLTSPSSSTRDSHKSLSGLEISTIDNAQGSQRPATVVDLVAASSPGFTDRADRLATALTRCQEVCIIVMDLQQLGTSLKPGRPLDRLINLLRERDAVITLNECDSAIRDVLASSTARGNDDFEPDGKDVRDKGYQVEIIPGSVGDSGKDDGDEEVAVDAHKDDYEDDDGLDNVSGEEEEEEEGLGFDCD